MQQWLGFSSFFQTAAKVFLVWMAFYGTGYILRKPLRIDKAFSLVPSEIIGLLVFVLITVPLSLLGILNRTVCPVVILLMSFPGILIFYGSLKERLSKPGILTVLLLIVLAAVLLFNLTHASMPNLAFDDPLVTYAFQPDRWLNTGQVNWIDETTFSGFPLLYEMTAVWPASMASDRMNQLSVLQVFQMSLLAVAVFRGLMLLRVKKETAISVAIIILLTSSLYIWSSMAKTDTMAILFCTMALASAVRLRSSSSENPDFSPWLFMGAALAVKQTSALILIPFALYSARGFLRYKGKAKTTALLILLLLPFAYGVRTMIRTGSPTYPVYPLNGLVKEQWALNEPEENTAINSRSSYLYEQRGFPLAKHIGIFFAHMEGNILLLLAGTAGVLIAGKRRMALLSLPVFAYSIGALVLFWPPWWGAKYSILIYPFTAILGGYLLQQIRIGKLIACLLVLPSFIIPGFIAVAGDARSFDYRWHVTQSVLGGNWSFNDSGYKMIMCTPEGMTHMWANTAFSPETVIFSLHEEKRYFFDGTVIVGWRHPLGQRLYMENTLQEEIAILESLNVDLVGFYRDDPAVLEQENRLRILDYIGTGDILEPLIIIDGGYLLCRFNPDP